METAVATKLVGGPGFAFRAPADWRVRRTLTSAAARSPRDPRTTVSAAVYRLGRRYRPDEFEAASAELDGVAAKLARAAGGELTGRETTTVAGRKVRAYRFTSNAGGRASEDRIAFLLDGRREVQLLCVAPAGAADPDGSCALLFASFRLAGAGY